MDPSSIIKEKKATFVAGGAYSSSPQNATTLRIFNENMQPESVKIIKRETFVRKLSVTFIAEPGLEKYIGIKCKFAGDEKEMSFVEHLLKFGIKVTVSKTINIKKTITEAMDDEDISRALNVILETNENRTEPSWHISIILSQMAEDDLGEMFDQYGLERQGCAICPQNHVIGSRGWTNEDYCNLMQTMIHEFYILLTYVTIWAPCQPWVTQTSISGAKSSTGKISIVILQFMSVCTFAMLRRVISFQEGKDLMILRRYWFGISSKEGTRTQA
jgi:hypothetical protein